MDERATDEELLALVAERDRGALRVLYLRHEPWLTARLSRCCAGRPNLLVLDEPATGLDPEQRLRLRALVSDHGRIGTVLLSTHQTAEVAAYCQRVLVLLDGTVRFDGTPEGLAELARGRVWAGHSDRPGDHSWLTADGHPRAVGDPPPGAEILDPTIDDGYLLLVRGAGTTR